MILDFDVVTAVRNLRASTKNSTVTYTHSTQIVQKMDGKHSYNSESGVASYLPRPESTPR